jgi:hypothetical protein
MRRRVGAMRESEKSCLVRSQRCVSKAKVFVLTYTAGEGQRTPKSLAIGEIALVVQTHGRERVDGSWDLSLLPYTPSGVNHSLACTEHEREWEVSQRQRWQTPCVPRRRLRSPEALGRGVGTTVRVCGQRRQSIRTWPWFDCCSFPHVTIISRHHTQH